MSIPQLEAALRLARMERASGNYSTASRNSVLIAERNLAAANGEPYAVPVAFPVSWDTGAPRPYLLQNDYQTFLTFFMSDMDTNWDGSYATARHPNRNNGERIAVVEFERCTCTKMGTPNDEVLHGHPLHGRGLAGYEAMSVENSAWLKELEAINSVHSGYKAGAWRNVKHYIAVS